VPGWKKALLVALSSYLALAFDLVPNFIPVGFVNSVARICREILAAGRAVDDPRLKSAAIANAKLAYRDDLTERRREPKA
jgi:hypothetical protein